MPDRDAQLDAAEARFAQDVAAALTGTANEFADALTDATELVAARFSVGRIARMWKARVTGLVRSLLRISETAARASADDGDTELPDGWDDLPGRYDDRSLPDSIGWYATMTEDLLNAVGDRLAEATRGELAAGLDAGEDVDQLRDRLRAAFTRDGAKLGPGREVRIARTEASRAWNTATLAAARDASGPDKPLVKQWITRHDTQVRHAHADADGQIRHLGEPFTVGGVSMDAPGDPSAPARLVINCRCRLGIAPELHAAASEMKAPPRAGVYETEENMNVTAADSRHTGAMIALVPTAEDAERLALTHPGGEPAHELHLTLFYLGDGADWAEGHRAELIDQLQRRAPHLEGHVHGRAFGANQWNADGDEPCWVWAIGDDRDAPDDNPRLDNARNTAIDALASMRWQPDLPAQHTPWAGHVCAAYSRSPALLAAMTERLGPVRFDRLRVAFAGEYTDIPLGPEEEQPLVGEDTDGPALAARAWSTPGDTALAFEDEETGDGRVFRPGSLYWAGPGPWPLQYADEMLMGHEGAELAGSIQSMARDGERITAAGVLYPGRPAGADAVMLLEENAPLGVSVDLDDVTVEFVDRTIDQNEVALVASLPSASLLRLDDGSWALTATSITEWTASTGGSLSRTTSGTQLFTEPNGHVSAAAVQAALGPTGTLTAAAGDRDTDTGTVVHSESAGDLLMRVTRARLRGATLVAMPAYDRARIVLDELPAGPPAAEEETTAASGPSETHMRVVRYVKAAPVAVGAREVARALGMKMTSVRGHLARAAKVGRLVRLAPGLYVGPATEGADLAASASGDLDLPVHDDRDRTWDGDAARSRILEWATDGDDVDADKLGAAFLYRDADTDPATVGAYKLPFADVINDRLEIVAAAVYTIAAVLQGGRGGVDISEDEADTIRGRVETLYGRLADAFDDPSIVPPWVDDDTDDEGEAAAAGWRDLEASAWTAMREADPMPAAWFREPTEAELPPGSGGVHYADGRIYGWVAQVGEPHAGFPGRNLTIESLGRIDLTHFLRAKFKLDDGSMVKAGAFTMNAPHHRDGAECESAACQFDDTRTVAGIVTVGMNSRGMWFSGAAAPWLSEWDRNVFSACQPSYHMKQGSNEDWQLRAVLSVPVPGHSSPLRATAVAERSNLALAASAAVRTGPGSASDTAARGDLDQVGHRTDTVSNNARRAFGPAQRGGSGDIDSVAASLLTSVPFIDGLLAVMDRRQEQRDTEARDEARRLAASVIAPAREEIAAGPTTEGDA
ncbi:phage minor head protein [Streptomyces sulphureus]|uniref:phage minor head protein n=1 Tax=Streptomyces sulphureus TaxID=47758 RepID=UPI00037BBE5F|nr:phage minor head protein [Streptomyces sulphureus]